MILTFLSRLTFGFIFMVGTSACTLTLAAPDGNKVHINVNGEMEEFDIDDLEVGESKVFTNDDGEEVTIKKLADGLDIDKKGKKVQIRHGEGVKVIKGDEIVEVKIPDLEGLDEIGDNISQFSIEEDVVNGKKMKVIKLKSGETGDREVIVVKKRVEKIMKEKKEEKK